MNSSAIWKFPLSAVVFGSLAVYLMRMPPDSAGSAFQTPMGVIPLKSGTPFRPPLRNGYLKLPNDDGSNASGAVYRVSISAERIDGLVDRLANELLPEDIYAVLVASNCDPHREDADEVTYLTDFRNKTELQTALKPYRFRLVHDGFVGFGFAWHDGHAPDRVEEVFVTPKKILVIHSSHDARVEQVLQDERIPLFDHPCFITDYETAVTDLRGCAELYGHRFQEYRDDKFLTSVYVPQLIEAAGFQRN